jgi:DNA-binding CsgD family transcriptional regulator
MDINPTEKQIIHLVAEGKADKEIAEHLNMKQRTVRYYLSNIFMKIGTDNRANLVHVSHLNKILGSY